MSYYAVFSETEVIGIDKSQLSTAVPMAEFRNLSLITKQGNKPLEKVSKIK